MYTLDAGSIGPQFGGSSTDYVVFVMNETVADKVPSGKLKLGADAGAYLRSSGATTQGLNDSSLGAEVLIYARPKGGVFAGASLGDASMTIDDKANRKIYGRPITATEIVRDGNVLVPDAAQPFRAALPGGRLTAISGGFTRWTITPTPPLGKAGWGFLPSLSHDLESGTCQHSGSAHRQSESRRNLSGVRVLQITDVQGLA